MKPESSLPQSQEPVTYPYNEPDQYSLRLPTSPFLMIYSDIILPSTRRSTKWSVSLKSPHRNTTQRSIQKWMDKINVSFAPRIKKRPVTVAVE